MNIYIDKTICVNLEKEFKNISFKRKFKDDIKLNIINFIKFKINQYLLTKSDLSPVDLIESSFVYLSKHFIFSTSSQISFDAIIGIKSSFFYSEKDNILSYINPIYYDLNKSPKCLSSNKNILVSKNFILTIALNSFMKIITQNQLNLSEFSIHLNNFSKEQIIIPQKFHILFEEDNYKKLKYYFLTLKFYFNSHKNSFYANGCFRNTAILRDIAFNYKNIIPLINDADLNLDKDLFYSKFSKNFYHLPANIHHNIYELCLDFMSFIIHNIDIEKALKLFDSKFYAPEYLKNFKL